jgi:hypothetical protein
VTGTVTELNLATATDSDDTENYLTTSLTTDLTTLGGKFTSTGGHGHTGATGDAAKIGSAGLANGAATGAVLGTDVITTTDLNRGAWTTWTPTASQSVALTLSSAVGRYIQIGKMVIATADITINSTGTAGQVVVIGGLPVTSTQRGNAGAGSYFDVSATTDYHLFGTWQSTTQVALGSNNSSTASGAGGFGLSPAVTAAAGDIVHLTLVYEAA